MSEEKKLIRFYIIRKKRGEEESKDGEKDLVYVGSTSKNLKDRFYNHIACFESKNSRENPRSHFLFVKYDVDGCEIIQLEERECDKEEQKKIEGKWIRKYREEKRCVNRCEAGKSDEEWRIENKEHLKEYNRNYAINHRKRINKRNNERNKQRVLCHHCNKEMNRGSLYRHIKDHHPSHPPTTSPSPQS